MKLLDWVRIYGYAKKGFAKWKGGGGRVTTGGSVTGEATPSNFLLHFIDKLCNLGNRPLEEICHRNPSSWLLKGTNVQTNCTGLTKYILKFNNCYIFFS